MMTLGLWVETVHTNTMGFMHGGMIATVCDSAMARSTLKGLGFTQVFNLGSMGRW